MRFASVAAVAVAAFTVLLAGAAAPAAAQSWTPPSPDERCPSKWGADDERGAANHMGPETVLKAARLIQTGRVIELGRVLRGLRGSMPLGARHFDLYLADGWTAPRDSDCSRAWLRSKPVWRTNQNGCGKGVGYVDRTPNALPTLQKETTAYARSDPAGDCRGPIL